MNDTLRSVLDNKDQIIISLQQQIHKFKRNIDLTKQMRQQNEKDTENKERENQSIRKKIDQIRSLADSKKQDPVKQHKIQLLKGQVEIKSSDVSQIRTQVDSMRDRLGKVKEQNIKLENIKQGYQNRIEKHTLDQEDQDYLENKLHQSSLQIKSLREQQDQLLKKMQKRQSNGQVSQDAEGVSSVIQNVKRLNECERSSVEISRTMKSQNQKIGELLEKSYNLLAQNKGLQDKMIYTIGLQRGGSRGSIGFLIRYFLNDLKIQRYIQELLGIQSHHTDKVRSFYDQKERLAKKSFDNINENDIEESMQVNSDTESHIMKTKNGINEYQLQLLKTQSHVENLVDKLNLKLQKEIYERLRLVEQDNNQGSRKLDIINDSLLKFNRELNRLINISRLQYRREDFQDMLKTVEKFNNECLEIQANLYINRLVIDKSKNQIQDVGGKDINKFEKILKLISGYQKSLLLDEFRIYELERNVKDQQIKFNELVGNISEETHQNLLNQINEKQKQAQELQQRDRELFNVIEGRKSDLSSIRNQINDNDYELQNILVSQSQISFLQQNNQLSLLDIGEGEEMAQISQRQISQKTDRIKLQFSRMSGVNLNTFEYASDLLEQLDHIDTYIAGTEQKIFEGFQKAQNLDQNLKEMERKLRNQRMNECESQLKIANDYIERLKKILDKNSTTVSVILRDQNLLLTSDIVNDLEKKKEISIFGMDLEKKEKLIKQQFEQIETLRTQYEQLERDFQQKMREKGSSNSINEQGVRNNDGREYQNIKKEADKIVEEVKKLITVADGEISDDISHCKEVNIKMINKYRIKRERYLQCIELRSQKQDDFKELKKKIQAIQLRQSQLEQQIQQLGVSRSNPFAENILKYMQLIDRGKEILLQLDKKIDYGVQMIRNEAGDLDNLDQRVVKSVVLDDIYKILNEIKTNSESLDDQIDKIELQLKQMEKEIESFIIKSRSSSLFDLESIMKKLESNLEKLALKVQSTEKGCKDFKFDVEENQSHFDNKDSLLIQVESFISQVDQIEIKKDSFQSQLDLMKSRFALYDKRNFSFDDSFQLTKDAANIEELVQFEIKKLEDIHNKLQQLQYNFQEKTKFETERQKLLKQAKDSLKNNQELLSLLKQLLIHDQEKVEDFEVIYKSMINSEDYQVKRPIVEKKQRRIAQLRSDCLRVQEDRDYLIKRLENENAFNEKYINGCKDFDELKRIIQDNEKCNTTLMNDVKDLNDMKKSLDKKRKKLADAEIRQLSNKRRSEIEIINQTLQQQILKLHSFEQSVLDRERDLDSSFSPEKQSTLNRTIEWMKQTLSEFKRSYDGVEDTLRNINAEISTKDLEQNEPLSNLAREIDRLKKVTVDVKILNIEIEKIQIEILAKSTMLSSMDTEKRLKSLLKQVSHAQDNCDQSKEALMKIQEISKSYDGYTSGAEDEEFFVVLHSESRDQLSEFNLQTKTFQDLASEVNKLIRSVEQRKLECGGNLQNSDVEEINEKIARIEAKINKLIKERQEIEENAFDNRDKLAWHDVDQKLSRRKQEAEELSRIINEINTDNQDLRNKIIDEINSCQLDDKYNKYLQKLEEQIVNTETIEEKASEINKRKIDLDFDIDQAMQDLGNNQKDINQRLESLETNLILKKRIQDTLRSISQLHTLVKQVYNAANETFKKKPKEQPFKPPSNADEIDLMLAEMLQKLGINVSIKKLGGGYYMFGSKKIFCKIINGKLVVRVGGGYMGIEDFILQYGQQEADKLQNNANIEAKLIESQQQSMGNRVGSSIALKIPSSKVSTNVIGSPASYKERHEETFGHVNHSSVPHSQMNKNNSKTQFQTNQGFSSLVTAKKVFNNLSKRKE
ncbi:UNKNOWN [Stylonychia lemnae]|uniref:GAR domain-containing protein n=1 Tax=Stylonychia lemnae TaxID=5949 RepID=A0A078B7M2_STYLE|nr:UNKNOWN [Stylonychia lemnae]|eukprot:CDW90226.1 UNKNOWN [Stylonychia lemnae]